MKTENKQYKLKRWYPSLKNEWEVGDVAEWFDGYYWNKGKIILKGLTKREVENNPDFWELIEEEKPKPLFITEDGVECFDRDYYIALGDDFNKRNMRAYDCDAPYSPDVVRFKHESSANEYIWRNKRVFSYNDLVEWFKKSNTFSDLKTIAIERSEQ